MNNAGLPGTGIGGLFYLLLALSMPVVELMRSTSGRSDPGRRRQALHQFVMACSILGAVVGTVVAYLHVADVPSPLGVSGLALVTAPVVLAVLLLTVLVVGLRVWAWIVRDTEHVA
ncbi:hypothetical protein NPS01_40820 [Nocardioides psychrotolerans]|uniref:Uncharacterized protein n=1 Tax=Nocardioides psychrotolerans TaxID=1005945 RepID=A0A1I3RDJ5_9ACTN|nr:hypothetical protein [Nocardioides psychrotolerans]GEP40419.1 hypothetical protein NPS01_40820 [Nocardioides psychrotolerans]SFJ43759.1 hypothetical protein SAMN05216561_1313 [Nocardioides psychrotolerans]